MEVKRKEKYRAGLGLKMVLRLREILKVRLG